MQSPKDMIDELKNGKINEHNRLSALNAFNNGTLTEEGEPFFLKEFAKGKIEVSPDKLKKVAAMIGRVDKEEAKDIRLTGSKVNLLMKWKMARNAAKLKKESQRLAATKTDHDAALWAQRLSLVGKPTSAQNQARLEETIRNLSNEVRQLSGNAWRHPFRALRRKLKERMLDKIDSERRKNRLETKIQSLQNQVSSSSGLKKLFYKFRLKAQQRELNPREFYRGKNPKKMIRVSGRKDLEQDKQNYEQKISTLKIELNRNNNEYALTKKQRKAKQKELKQALKLQVLIEERLKKVNATYNNRCDRINDKYNKRENKKESAILDCCDIIRNRQQVLDKSTKRGKYFQAMLKAAPKNSRKELEEIANGRIEENVVDDAEFSAYLREKGFNDQSLEQLKLHIDQHRSRLESSSPTNDREPPRGRQGSSEPLEDQNTAQAEQEIPPVIAREPEAEVNREQDYNWISADKKKFSEAFDGFELLDKSKEQNLNLTFKKDDRELSIEKESAGYVAVTAKDDKGDKFPTVDEFRAIVRSFDNPEIALGPTQDDEYKARLMIAIELEGKKIVNLDKEKDLSSQMKDLSPETRAQLEALEQKNGRAPVTLGQEMPQPTNKENTQENTQAEKPKEEQLSGENRQPGETLTPKKHNLNPAQLEALEQNKAISNLSEEERKNLTWESLDSSQQKLLQDQKLGLRDIMKQEAQMLSELRGTLKDQNSVLGSSLSNLRQIENQDEAVQATVQKLEMADKIVNMNDEEYKKFQESEEYKSFGNEQERGLIDNVRNFQKDKDRFKQEKGDGKDASEAKSLGRMLSFYRGTKDNPDKLKKVIARELNPKLKANQQAAGRG